MIEAIIRQSKVELELELATRERIEGGYTLRFDNAPKLPFTACGSNRRPCQVPGTRRGPAPG